ncbi:MAG: hypothetical protein H6643_16300 [Caldilineaceae bacterium]|nr:hypothetical protein [Caldilineaceae bacterium]
MVQPGGTAGSTAPPPARDRRHHRHGGGILCVAGRHTGGCLCRQAPDRRADRRVGRTGPDIPGRQQQATVVLKRGPRGASVLAAGQDELRVPGFPVTVLNTVGAGDAFAGGLIYGRCQGGGTESASDSRVSQRLRRAGSGAAWLAAACRGWKKWRRFSIKASLH